MADYRIDASPETIHWGYFDANLKPLLVTGLEPGGQVRVVARRPDGRETAFEARVRIDTTVELAYYTHGGILCYVLRQLLADKGPATPVGGARGARR